MKWKPKYGVRVDVTLKSGAQVSGWLYVNDPENDNPDYLNEATEELLNKWRNSIDVPAPYHGWLRFGNLTVVASEVAAIDITPAS